MTRRDEFMSTLDRHLWRWLARVVVIVGIVSVVRSVIGDWSTVPSRSMTPAILPGDHIYVNKLAYDLKLPFTSRLLLQWADPKRGDVVVLFSLRGGTPLVKRVIAVPGDVPDGATGPLPAGKFYVMGDNRGHSVDSRMFGFVDRSQFAGRASVVLFSFDPERYGLPRWGRFFSRVG